MMPRPVYFTHSGTRANGQPFEENDPKYGHVYHLGSPEDVMKMIDQEQSIIWTAHPRTKSSETYPDGYKDKDFFLSDRFIGASWESLPVDLSEKRLCEVRCFGTNDDMSNWAPKPKYMLAEGDTYTKRPDDETYPQLAVNYLKLDRVPLYNESWAPIVEGIRAGNFFGTTGEILFHNWSIEGAGAKSIYNATIEYTFPLDFAELVWSDGTKIDRQIIQLTDTAPFGTKTFKIPFDATGKKWVSLRRLGLSRRWSVASTDRTEAAVISSVDKFLRARGRSNVLIHVEKVIGIVLRFSPSQPLVVIAVSCTNAVFAFAFHHEVHVRPSGSVGMQCLPVVLGPGGNAGPCWPDPDPRRRSLRSSWRRDSSTACHLFFGLCAAPLMRYRCIVECSDGSSEPCLTCRAIASSLSSFTKSAFQYHCKPGV